MAITPPASQRFFSLDVFRGATVALMILVNNPGSWSNIYPPLAHAPWHGCTPTDLVFPFFLFAVGNAMAFVFPRLEQAGSNVFLRKVFTRSILIFLIGLFLNWAPFVQWRSGELVFRHWVDPLRPENGVRILGVLQRIALCYLFASLIIYYFKLRGAFFMAFLLLTGYWMLCLFLGDPLDPFSLSGYFGNSIDRAILGVPHLYKGEGVPFDPEGLTSTIPAIVQVLFGYFAGHYIIQKGKNYEMVTHLLVAGGLLVFAGFSWDMSFPINKKIWTSSYVLYTSGLAMLVLGTMIYLIELRGYRGAPTRFFNVFGKNPLFIYFMSGFLIKVLALFRWVDHFNEAGKPVYTSALPWFYQHICKPVSDNLKNGSLLYAIALVLFFWAMGWWMDRKKIYIRV